MTNENPLLLTDYKLYFRGYNLHISDVIKKHIFENITKSQLAKDSEYYEAEKVKAFEAGRKEVVECVEDNSYESNSYWHSLLFPKLLLDKEKWQALKADIEGGK